MKTRLLAALAGAPLALAALPMPLFAQEGGGKPDAAKEDKAKPDFPTWKETAEGFEKVTTSGDDTLYGIWTRAKDNQMLAELPRGWANQKHLFAMTVPTGETFTGLQAGERYVYWKRFDKRMALVEPQIDVRSTGDPESKDAITKTFVDRVLVDVPIVCMGPSGQPVIDMDELLLGNMSSFYGGLGNGANKRLAVIKSAKSFPQNLELSFELPVAGGAIKTFHYSISVIPDNTGYKPRKADERVGYFTVSYRDLGKFKYDEVWNRYITRWNLEKRDPNLKLSPPKKPIIFYVENTVPPRYRRWVKEGILYWNRAFEKGAGIVDAIEVYYQDKETGAHMDKDPEDVRYNFIRWVANDIGTAIGPSRKHPMTGEILDADIILTDGWIRHFWFQSNEFLPASTAMEGMSPETIAWLDRHPSWDPRVRLASPDQREKMINDRASGILRYGGRATVGVSAAEQGADFQRLASVIDPSMQLCMAAYGKANDMAVLGLQLECLGLMDPPAAEGDKDAKKDDKKDDKKDGKKDDKKAAEEKPELIDGVPEWFLGPMLADLTAHEVGHTLGLRHNFKASSIYSLAKINSEEIKGKKPFAGSVMDYIPVNIKMDGDGAEQGDYTMISVGPYDMWAIEYGYTSGDLKDVLKRVSEPELAYGTDEDTGGPDPLARRYDFAQDPRDYAVSRMKLAKFQRSRILEKFVKDGESWSKARRGYQITLNSQTDGVNIMSNWLGGAFVTRDKKGDPGARSPITPVPAAQQRAALKFVIDNTFQDDVYGLTPDLLQRMTVDKWFDGGSNPGAEPTWPVHDRIMGIQASVLTMLMNPTTLRRVYDNEFLIPKGEEALTLPELLDTVSNSIWTELEAGVNKSFTAREPMISSLRRNLQREHLDRLIDLSLGDGAGAAGRPIATLSVMKLRELQGRIGKITEKNGATKLDPYTLAHLTECKMRIDKSLDAQYLYNGQGGGMGGMGGFFFGQPSAQPAGQLAPEQQQK